MSIMKYFTKEWCWGGLDDDQVDEVLNNYGKHINEIYSKLPVSLKIITETISLHDGILKEVIISKKRRSLFVFGVFGDLQVGYFSLRIEYENVHEDDFYFAEDFFKNQNLEIIRDEIDLFKGSHRVGFIHRFIFSNKSEFQIRFDNCSLFIKNASQKEYIKKKCSLVVQEQRKIKGFRHLGP